jgi:uncharacterized protein YbjT (DUF2867 family)
MKVLITGANGCIGTRLLPVLLEKGYEVVCLVRDKQRFKESSDFGDKVSIVTGDLLKESSIQAFPADIDIAYYLVNSQQWGKDFSPLLALSAHNFVKALDQTSCKQLILLSTAKPANGLQLWQQLRQILSKAKAILTIGPIIPRWYLIWPFYQLIFKQAVIGSIKKSAEKAFIF